MTVRERGDVEDGKSFNPEYAHQIFGEAEIIFGYKDLQVSLFYTAGALNIFMGSKYSNRIDDFNRDGLKADDVTSKISELLTTGCYFTNIDEFLKKLDKEKSFVPMGTKIDNIEITHEGRTRTFEFYLCDITTPNFLPFHARLQTFIMWFVDAASYIDTDDPQWMFFLW